jgi:phage shock protein A
MVDIDDDWDSSFDDMDSSDWETFLYSGENDPEDLPSETDNYYSSLSAALDRVDDEEQARQDADRAELEYQESLETADNEWPWPSQYISPVRYTCDDTGFYTYLLMDGTAEDLNRVTKQLFENRVKCVLSGPSYKPASNGESYQWYLRIILIKRPPEYSAEHWPQNLREAVSFAIPPERNRHTEGSLTVESLLPPTIQAPDDFLNDSTVVTTNDKTSVGFNSQYARKIQEADDKIDRLESEIKSLKSLLQSANSSNVKSRQKQRETAEEINRLRREQTEYAQEVAEAQQGTDKNRESLGADHEREVKDLISIIHQKDEQLNEQSGIIDELAAEQSNEVENKNTKITKLENKVATLLHQADSLRDVTKSDSVEKNGSGKVRKSSIENQFSQIIKILLPQIILDKRSKPYLLWECQTYSDALKKIRHLNDKGMLPKSKRVQNTDHFHEVHFNTGTNMLGRLYFMRDSDNKFVVNCSSKHEQKQIVPQLKKFEKEHKRR